MHGERMGVHIIYQVQPSLQQIIGVALTGVFKRGCFSLCADLPNWRRRAS